MGAQERLGSDMGWSGASRAERWTLPHAVLGWRRAVRPCVRTDSVGLAVLLQGFQDAVELLLQPLHVVFHLPQPLLQLLKLLQLLFRIRHRSRSGHNAWP